MTKTNNPTFAPDRHMGSDDTSGFIYTDHYGDPWKFNVRLGTASPVVFTPPPVYDTKNPGTPE